MREVLEAFAEEQEKVLQKNDWKTGWGNMTLDQLWVEAQDHLHDLLDAIKSGKQVKILKECCDVANFIMFIADNNGLPDLETSGVKRLKLKDVLHYRRGSTIETMNCEWCQFCVKEYEVLPDMTIEPRCKVMGLKDSRKYRIRLDYTCNAQNTMYVREHKVQDAS